MDIPGFGSSEKVDRVDHGYGFVREHSIEIGDTIIVFNNIGTISIIDGSKSPWPLIVGGIIGLVGLAVFAMPFSSKPFALLLLIVGIALIAWWFRMKPDRFLSIGSCDGKRTNIVSKDRAFLLKLRTFLRERIDKEVFSAAKIDIKAGTIVGLSTGPNSQGIGSINP